jgi:hypothetical protein
VILFLLAGSGFGGFAVASGGLHGFFPFQPPPRMLGFIS